jgi:hypothetical protein
VAPRPEAPCQVGPGTVGWPCGAATVPSLQPGMLCYQRVDIPRVRYGHRVMFVKEDLENWVRSSCEGGVLKDLDEQGVLPKPVDGRPGKVYHRNPLFVLPRHKGMR